MSQASQPRAGKGCCHKCGGFLVAECVVDFYWPMSGWRCVNCGWCRCDNVQCDRIAGCARNRGA